MAGHEPWEYGGDPPQPNIFEKLIVVVMVIISAIFFRPPKKHK